jgi:hypothetical protein
VRHFEVVFHRVDKNGVVSRQRRELCSWEHGSLLFHHVESAWLSMLVRLALRHTLVRGWLTAAQGLADAPPPGLVANGQDVDADTAKEAARADMYALLKLALILTWDVVA